MTVSPSIKSLMVRETFFLNSYYTAAAQKSLAQSPRRRIIAWGSNFNFAGTYAGSNIII